MSTTKNLIEKSAKSVTKFPRILEFIVDGVTPALGGPSAGEATLIDNGVGDYTVTFTTDFVTVPICIITPVTDESIGRIDTAAVGSVIVKTDDATDGTTAKDVVFHLLVIGHDASDVV